jgi:hypothetical protein
MAIGTHKCILKPKFLGTWLVQASKTLISTDGTLKIFDLYICLGACTIYPHKSLLADYFLHDIKMRKPIERHSRTLEFGLLA